MSDETEATPKVRLNRGNAGKGRPKGSPNKTTTILKDAILKAAEMAGDPNGIEGYLTAQAQANPGPFMALLGKVLPLQVTGDDDGGPLKVIIERDVEKGL
jgi:hypothetical protein